MFSSRSGYLYEFLFLHLASLVTCQDLKGSWSCCENPISPKFVVHLTKSLPRGTMSVIVSNAQDCPEALPSPMVKELHENFTKTVIQSLSLHPSEQLYLGIARLEKTIKFLSQDSKQIFVLALCFDAPRLLPHVDKVYRKFPWVRWLLLTKGQGRSDSPDHSLFVEYPSSSCKIAVSYEEAWNVTFYDTETIGQRENNYIIEGPNIESCNCTKRVQIGKWIAKNKKLLPAKPNDFFRLSRDLHIINRTLRIATMDNFPFFVQEIVSDRKVIGKDGIDLKIIEILAEKFNFKFQVLTPSDRVWGVKLPNGEWSGLFRMILNQEVDFAITNIGMINERQEAIDYTYPYMTDSLNFLVRAPREKSRALAIIRPFTLEVWVGLLLVVLLASLFTTFVGKKTCDPTAQKWNFRQALWYYFGALTLQGGAQNLPTTKSLRIIVTFYWFFAIITMAGFSGSLTSYMNFPEKESPIDTISELVKRMNSGQIKVGTLHGALPYSNFMSATEGDMYRIGKEIKRDEERTLVKDIETGAFRTMQESYAFVFPRSFVEGTLASVGIKDYHFGKEQFYINFFAIAVPKGSPMKDAFSEVLKRLNEMGLVSKWYKDVLSRRERQNIFSKVASHGNTTTPVRPLNKEEQNASHTLQLEDLQGAYIFFFVGLAFALLVFLLELRLVLYNCCKSIFC